MRRFMWINEQSQTMNDFQKIYSKGAQEIESSTGTWQLRMSDNKFLGKGQIFCKSTLSHATRAQLAETEA